MGFDDMIFSLKGSCSVSKHQFHSFPKYVYKLSLEVLIRKEPSL